MSLHPKENDAQKRARLAKTIGVTPDRLVTLSGTTCRRINTAILRYPIQDEEQRLTWRELMRTPGVGYRSASELCDALGIPKTLTPPAVRNDDTPNPETSALAERIANVINTNPQTSEHYQVFKSEGPCPSFVLEDHSGTRFRVRVERMY
jgi:hypothetical protein